MSMEQSRKRSKKPSSASLPSSFTGDCPDLTLRPAGLNDAEVDVFQQLLSAISNQRLMPGVKLTEEELATIFSVTRERIRRVLLVLSQQGIVTLEPNRGASVARPTLAQRRDAFETRRILEIHVVRQLAVMPLERRQEICAQLSAHLIKEHGANESRDRNLQVRLSGEFHLLLAAYNGNQQILRVLQELQALTALALVAHAHPHDRDCSLSEHQQLIDALLEGNVEGAAHIVAHHLNHVEAGMDEPDDGASILKRVFAVAR